MKKKLLLVLAIICCLVLMTCVFAACNPGAGAQNPGGNTPGGGDEPGGGEEPETPIEPINQYLMLEESEDGSYWIALTGTNGAEGVIEIPSEYQGKPVKAIGHYAFDDTNVTQVIIPDSIESIGMLAFKNCPNLTTIDIPESVKKIGFKAFSECCNLASITGGEGVENVEKLVFNDTLYYQNLPEGLFYFGKTAVAFKGTIQADTAVEIKDGTLSIADGAFENQSNLAAITLPTSVANIGKSAFQKCSALTAIAIPEGVTTINNDTFNYCSALDEVTIPASVTSIGQSAFNSCKAITKVNISDIASWCNIEFASSGNPLSVAYEPVLYLNGSIITDVTIPREVTEIADYAFAKQSSIKYLTIPEGVKSIGKYAFEGTGIWEINIPDSVEQIGSSAFHDTVWYDNNTTSDTTNELLYIGDFLYSTKMTSMKYEITDVYIKNGTRGILDGALKGCNQLKTIDMPSSVRFIGSEAFYNCSSLTSIVIPYGVETIGNKVFYNCSKLASVVIPDSVTEIGEHIFDGCKALKELTIPGSVKCVDVLANKYCPLESITVKEGVEEIGGGIIDGAFSKLKNLTHLYLPDTIVKIGENAVSSCDNLQSINFGGTMAQWEAIEKHEDWKGFNSSKEYTIVCKDGTVTA